MSETYLRRYTDITSLINILTNQELILVDPKSWDDKNDSHFIDVYKEKMGLKSVLALCFSQSSETYHHWSVFAKGPSGVCIKFKKSSIESFIKKNKDLKLKELEYLTVKELSINGIKKNDLPFVKRTPFEPEKEIRLLWESKNENISSFSLKIDISSIVQITVSPWMHKSLLDSIRILLKSIEGCEKLKIIRSTIISNSDWFKYGENAK